tara:strand:- start:30 stop:392 length:363 start_codon:yes stop_codon:yes gene_type:complete
MISNKAISSVQGVTLICDDDRRGYNFIGKDKVEISIVDLDDFNIVSLSYLYELTENVIFIKQRVKEFNKTNTIGWIFRRNLDYVSLYYERGDLSRKFLWSCEITSLKDLETRLKNKLNNK